MRGPAEGAHRRTPRPWGQAATGSPCGSASSTRASRSCLTAQTTRPTQTAATTDATAISTVPLPPEGLDDGVDVGEHDQAAGGDPEHPGRQVPHQPGRERGGDHAADQQRRGEAEVDALAAEREQEAERAADRDDELRGVDRADHLAGLEPARGEQRGGADRAPATAADGVHQAGDDAERGEEDRGQPALEGRPAAAEGQEPVDDVDAEAEQQRRHPRLRRVAGDAGQERRAGERADAAGYGDDAHRAPVDVAELVVGEPGDQRGADLGEVDGGRGGGRAPRRWPAAAWTT